MYVHVCGISFKVEMYKSEIMSHIQAASTKTDRNFDNGQC